MLSLVGGHCNYSTFHNYAENPKKKTLYVTVWYLFVIV